MAPWVVDNTGMTSTSPLGPWQLEPNSYVYSFTTFNSPDATQFAICNADAGGSGSFTSTRMTSPTFSLAGLSAATLSFQHYYNRWATGDVNVNIEISTNGGASWTVINNYFSGGVSVGTSTAFATATWPLTAYLGNANCQIRFNYATTYGFYWAIDNVLITGTPSTGGTALWSPTTNAFTNPACTVPYTTGTPAANIYIHPTTVLSPTVFNYIATTSNGTCTSADTAVVTVNPGVAPITGTTSFCAGNSVTLSNTALGGTWSSSNTSIATVNPATGMVTGLAPGVDTIFYTVTGCTGFIAITVGTGTPITGSNFSLCPGGSSTTLSNVTGSGTWTSGSPSIATVSPTGVVTSGVVGSAIITYTMPSGCIDTALITVIPPPPAISGTLVVCQSGGVTSLSNTVTGGTWTSGSPSLATVTSSTGIVTGINPGNVVITYTAPTTCYITATVTVGTAIAGITGTATVCPGTTTTLFNSSPGGTWSSNPTTTATVDPVSGVVTGVAAGTAIVTYAALNGCSATRIVTVNPLPAAISGTPAVCLGLSTTLSDITTGGTWSSANSAIASINSATGEMTGASVGNTLIVYTITSTGCNINVPVTVNALPAAITGATTTVCSGGAVISLSDATSGGTWSSGATAIATATGTSSGIITGVSTGTAPITYTITSTGCIATTNVTVLPIPAPITGTASVCEAGSTTALSDATFPGTWSSSATSIATVTSTGLSSSSVTGVSVGSATITYTITNSCFVTTTVTVNPLPAALMGTFSVCHLSTTTLSSTSGGGSWTTGSPFVATVTGGAVTGLNPGTAAITYTLPTGCLTSANVTVNPIPGIIGGDNYVCNGNITVVTDSVPGGTWSSSPTAIATIDASGTVHGVALGTFTVTYSTGTAACFSTKAMTVNPIVPTGVTMVANPGTTVCAGTPVLYTVNTVNAGSSPMYVWSVNNVILSGASSYSYTPVNGDVVRCWIISSYSCSQPDTASSWVTMTVNPIVTPALSLNIAGGDTTCLGNAVTINAAPVGGGPAPLYQWFVNTVAVGTPAPAYTYTPANGDIIVADMVSNAPCRTATSASASKIITVSPYVAPVVTLSSNMGPTVCDGYPVIYTATQLNGGWSPSYQWSVNGTNTGVGPGYTYMPINSDVVSVTLTSSFPCAAPTTATTNMLMTVLPVVAPVGSIDVSPGYIVTSGTPVTFTANIVSGGGLSPTYQWLRNAIPMPGATNSTYTTSTLNDGDSISLQVINTDPCSGITTFSAVKMSVGSNVGVHDVTNNQGVMILPNPTTGRVTVEMSFTSDNTVISIVDLTGKVLDVKTTKESRVDMDLSNYAKGIYFINIQSGAANYHQKIVVE